MKKTLACICSLFIYFGASSQCFLKELNLDQRTNKSDLIVEGKVTSQNSFWNNDHTMIYTSNLVEVYKVFKGMVTADEIEIITEGGVVGLDKISTNSLLHLSPGETGIFFCETPKHVKALPPTASAVSRYEAYGSKQGFIKYDLQHQEAADPFHKYHDVQNELYKHISPSLKYTEKKAFNIKSSSSNVNTLAAPMPLAVTGFSPTTITAGTGSILTITGNSFGATQGSGYVQFRNADDGGASFISPLQSQYISWSDTEIRVQVPSNAGTGVVRVVQGAVQTSAATLTITYAHLNVDFDPGSGTVAYQPDHINDNGSGGYTWRMNTGFDANAAARASFVRAFDSWRCTGTEINWTIGATTAINDAVSDGTNIICFDNAAPLSAGVLGVCYTYWSGCASGPTIQWFVSELDIIFDEGSNIAPTYTWEYGPATPSGTEYDFETVAVHELGHGHQLGHVISPGAIMHYAIFNGSANRTLGVNDLAGGNYVQARSEVANVCGPGAMTSYTGCTVLPLSVAGLKAYQKESGVQVEWSMASEKDILQYEIEESIDGTTFTAAARLLPKGNNGSGASYQWFDRQVNSDIAYYRIRSVTLNGNNEYSDIMRVKMANGKPGFQVYPNPLKDQPLTVEMSNMEKGIYLLSLYNVAGQQVLSKKIVHNGGSAVHTISLPLIAAGVHRLVMKSNTGTLQQTILIEK
ncbi:IPT/TIG domain-containing protein [Longitalea arenae]|uniref:IPT/TIG domain-containing protein n=1 Tax=Longitalea arenae TaxID=2812558 RepID=UPI001966D862|nr:IPT/TIG domain-containing protein [Longitalea arenae]